MKERKRRGNSRYYLFFLLTIILTASIGAGFWYALRHLPYFTVNKVKLSGNSVIPDSLIYSKTSSYVGQNLFSISSKQIRKDLHRLSRVKEVVIRKKLMGTLTVEVTERQAILYVKSFEGNLFPMDGDGVVLAKYSKIYQEDVPIFSSYYSDNQFKAGLKLNKPTVSRVLAFHQRIMKEAPDFVPIISEYFLIDNTINIIDARYGTWIIPSNDDLATQFRRYQFVQDNGDISRRSTVDLRFDNQVVVKAGDK